MPLAFSKYKEVYQKYCISYQGTSNDHLVQLKLLFPQLQNYFTKVKISLACPRSKLWILDAIPNEELNKDDFLHIKYLKTNLSPPHVIYNLFKESDVPIKPVCEKVIDKTSGICLILPEGMPPTKSFPNLKLLDNLVRQQGFSPLFLGLDSHQTLPISYRPNEQERIGLLDKSDAVMAVESDILFLAAVSGKPTTLLATGLGTELYQKMFLQGKVIKNLSSGA